MKAFVQRALRAAERRSFRVWFIIESCVYISSPGSVAQGAEFRAWWRRDPEIEPIKVGIFRQIGRKGRKVGVVIEHGVYTWLYIPVYTGGPLKGAQGNVKSSLTAEKLTTSWLWHVCCGRLRDSRRRCQGKLKSNHHARSTLCNYIHTLAILGHAAYCWNDCNSTSISKMPANIKTSSLSSLHFVEGKYRHMCKHHYEEWQPEWQGGNMDVHSGASAQRMYGRLLASCFLNFKTTREGSACSFL